MTLYEYLKSLDDLKKYYTIGIISYSVIFKMEIMDEYLRLLNKGMKKTVAVNDVSLKFQVSTRYIYICLKDMNKVLQ